MSGASTRMYKYCETEDCGPYVYEAGTLLIDLVDARTQQLVWRGWAEAVFDDVIDNQRLMEVMVDDTVKRIFRRLPRPSNGLPLVAAGRPIVRTRGPLLASALVGRESAGHQSGNDQPRSVGHGRHDDTQGKHLEPARPPRVVGHRGARSARAKQRRQRRPARHREVLRTRQARHQKRHQWQGARSGEGQQRRDGVAYWLRLFFRNALRPSHAFVRFGC